MNQTLKRITDDMHATIISANGFECRVNLTNFKKLWADPFYISFRMLMESFHEFRLAEPNSVPFPDPVDFYFDEWSKKDMIRRSWNDYVASRDEDVRPFYGKEPRFEDDNEFLPIQAADFRAWWVRKWAKEHGPENIGKGEFPFENLENRMEHLLVTTDEENLRSLIASALKSHLEAVDRAMVEGSDEVRFIPDPPFGSR